MRKMTNKRSDKYNIINNATQYHTCESEKETNYTKNKSIE